MKTISQKNLNSPWKTILANFFSYYRVWQTSSNTFLGSTRKYGNLCASCKIISLGHTRSIENNFWKRVYFPNEKQFWPIFPYYRIGQSSGNFLLGSTKYDGNHCASYKMICVIPRRLLKTQLFDKKDFFPARKVFRAIFSRTIEWKKTSRSKLKGYTR